VEKRNVESFLVYSMPKNTITDASAGIKAWLRKSTTEKNITKRFALEELTDAHLAA
jgi:hypothetical protein